MPQLTAMEKCSGSPSVLPSAASDSFQQHNSTSPSLSSPTKVFLVRRTLVADADVEARWTPALLDPDTWLMLRAAVVKVVEGETGKAANGDWSDS